MQVTCSKCNSKYKIGDSKLKGRDRIRLRCKKCDNIIEAKVKNIADEDTSSLFSMSSNKSITDAVKSEADIFEESLFAGAKDEFSFEDAQQTLMLNTTDLGKGASNKKDSQPKFKSDFQMDFSENTGEFNSPTYNNSDKKAGSAVSFETTQQVSIDKFNEYQRNKENEKLNAMNMGSPKLATTTQKLVKNKSRSSIDNSTRDKFDDISKEFSDKPAKSGGGGILKFIFILFFVISLVFAFVLYKNNWQLDLGNIKGMVDNAIGGVSDNSKASTKKVLKSKSLKEQFFIDGKKIKAKLFKLSKRRKDKKHALAISGEIKNIDNTKKSLTTVSVKIENILNNEVILEKSVYAGNFFTKKEILKAKNDDTLAAEYLQSGKNGANWGVMPNKVVPFMIVFYVDNKINLSKVKIKVEIKSTQ